jgi:hypothetical protein
VRLRFVGKDSPIDDSPTLYDTDRNTHLVQGWKVTDPDLLSRLDLGPHETCVEVTTRLMSYLSESELTNTEDTELPLIIRTGRDTYVIKGRRVTDAEALAQLNMPDHETAIEVSAALRLATKEQHAEADA